MPLRHLLANNRAWSEKVRLQDSDFFPQLARQQSPKYLWIGCSDSRVPANEIVGLLPGELFVHRNVANIVVHTDLNCLTVMQFAVDVLHVEHVIVCGHYGCSGVRAAMKRQRLGLSDNWLRHVQDVEVRHRAELAAIGGGAAGATAGDAATDEARANRLCELNVIEQVVNVCGTTIVGDAWARGQRLLVHGWIYGLEDGLVHDRQVTAANAGDAAALAARIGS